MATDDPTRKFDYEGLTALAAQLTGHADQVLARKDAERDMRYAAEVCHRFASLRFAVGEVVTQIGATVASHAPEAHEGADVYIRDLNEVGRKLRDALDAAGRGN
jgi:hypothetical protein